MLWNPLPISHHNGDIVGYVIRVFDTETLTYVKVVEVGVVLSYIVNNLETFHALLQEQLLVWDHFQIHCILQHCWKPTFERRLIFGCAFEGFLRFAITFEVPTTVLWGRRKSLPAVWCHWLTVAVIYF